ncbi:MAG: ATP-grasp domain-containing protein [Desulfobacteraceae bacterium]
MQKKILFLCDASDIDIVEHSFKDQEAYSLTIETIEKILSFGIKEYLSQTIERINYNPDIYDGIVGVHDSSAVFAAIIAQETGKLFSPVKAIINSQNKYLCRRIQKSLTPDCAAEYCLALDYLRRPTRMKTPFFIKPVRSNISFGTHKIDSPEQMEYYIGLESMDIALFNQYYLDALAFSSKYHDALNISTCNSFLCEEFISGTQVTMDGYIFKGEVFFIGFTKAEFYPRTNSFSHHIFPYEFSPGLDTLIKDNLKTLIPALGIDNSFFNVELRADEANETFKVIEVNCRIAFQFAKAIEAVKGFDPLKMLCDIAVGVTPEQDPLLQQQFKYCYNFELHAFSNAKILQTPTQIAYDEVGLKYPEVKVRNLIHENARLSDFKHNPESYRYCIIDVPGNSNEEIMVKFEHVVSILNYRFENHIGEAGMRPENPSRPPEQTKGGAQAFDTQPPVHRQPG